MTTTTHSLGLALLGGGLIGLAAGLLMRVNGRVFGVSGLIGGLLERRATPETLLVLGGIPLGLLLFEGLGGTVSVPLPESSPLLIVAGLLVGFGARLANGCTSGHAVCGIARLSKRSLVATAIFMAAAMAAVAALRAL